MWLMTESQIDRIVVLRRRLIVGGLLLVAQALALPRGWGCGGISGFMIFSLGIYGACFQKWKTDPGLWRLALLFTVTLGPCAAYFEYLHWQSVVVALRANQVRRVATWDQIRISVDAAVGLIFLASAVRLAASVAVENWRRTRVITRKT